MIKRVVAERGGRKVILMDSISHVDGGDAGHIVVSASHGGASSGEYASRHKLAAAVFNDAGVGEDNAGIAAPRILERAWAPAGAGDHSSAPLGHAHGTVADSVAA